jgi:hypothetical protein
MKENNVTSVTAAFIELKPDVYGNIAPFVAN